MVFHAQTFTDSMLLVEFRPVTGTLKVFGAPEFSRDRRLGAGFAHSEGDSLFAIVGLTGQALVAPFPPRRCRMGAL